MAKLPEPFNTINKDILQEYSSNLPDGDQEILREYYTRVTAVIRDLRDMLRAANKTEDELLREAVDEVCVDIPENRKKKIRKVLDKTYQYCFPRFMSHATGYTPGELVQENIFIPGSKCHYTKEFLVERDTSIAADGANRSPGFSECGTTFIHNTETTIHNPHGCSKVITPNVDLDKYQKIKIIELAPGKIHSNKVLYATTLADGHIVKAFYTVIEDDYGQCASLGIYHTTVLFRESLKRGTKIAIINPFYKKGLADGFYFIRVESPDEVVVLERLNGNEQNSEVDKSSEDYKKEGNEFFFSNSYTEAIGCYTHAISLDNSNPVYLCNRALCYLKLGLYEEALLDSESAVKMDTSNSKYQYRLATAWSGLGDHGKSVEILESINRNSDDYSDIESFLIKERRLLTNIKGEFDFDEIENKLKQGEEVKIGDYIGPVAIGTSPIHGHGLLATRDIQRGELIVVCRPVTLVTINKSDIPMWTRIEYNPDGPVMSESWDQIVQKLTEKISESKLTAFRVFHLHNKRSKEVAVSTEIYTSKGFEFIRDKAKPPYQMEQIRTIVSQNMASIVSKDTSDHYCKDPTKRVGVWVIPSYLNHSCVPNTFRSFIRDICTVRACTFIPKGSELTQSYANLYAEYDLGERRTNLERMHRPCNCELCQFESDANNANILKRAIDLRNQSKKLSESNPDEFMQDSHFKLLNQIMSLAEELNLGPNRFNADIWYAFNYLTAKINQVKTGDQVRFIEVFKRVRSYLHDSEVWHRFFYWSKLKRFSMYFCEIPLSPAYLDEIKRMYQEIDSLTRSLS